MLKPSGGVLKKIFGMHKSADNTETPSGVFGKKKAVDRPAASGRMMMKGKVMMKDRMNRRMMEKEY